MDEFYQVIQMLPPAFAMALSAIDVAQASTIHELRFKVGAPPMITQVGKQCDITTLLSRQVQASHRRVQGVLFAPSQDAQKSDILSQCLTQSQIEHLFFYLCGGSVHSYEDELRHGFFTLAGGHRVGVGGKYIPCTMSQSGFAKQDTWQLQQATSLNIRIARHKQIALPIEVEHLLHTRFTGVLILGEPDSGKTTLLRGFINCLQMQHKTVVVIDERGEFAITGIDVIRGMEKSNAVQLALRTLAPEVIALDELGTLAELHALEQGFFGGVDFIASLHAGSFAEAERKPQFQYLRSHGMLTAACLLRGRAHPGQIVGVKYYHENPGDTSAFETKHAEIKQCNEEDLKIIRKRTTDEYA